MPSVANHSEMLCYVGVNFSKHTIDKKGIHPGRAGDTTAFSGKWVSSFYGCLRESAAACQRENAGGRYRGEIDLRERPITPDG